MTDGGKPQYPMTKEQRRRWLDNLTPDDRAKLRVEHEKTREPWDRNRRQNRQVEAFRKQKTFIVEDLRKGASLQIVSKRYELEYGLLVAMLIDDGLLVLKAGAETVTVKR
jgi:hypothetical protein